MIFTFSEETRNPRRVLLRRVPSFSWKNILLTEKESIILSTIN